MMSYKRDGIKKADARIAARDRLVARSGLPKKIEALVRELPAKFLKRYKAEAKAFNFDVESHIQGTCERLAHDVLIAFDYSDVSEIRRAASPGVPGVIFRRNRIPKPFWLKQDEKRPIKEKLRTLRKVAAPSKSGGK